MIGITTKIEYDVQYVKSIQQLELLKVSPAHQQWGSEGGSQ
ncbi:hypothetical protein AB0N24_24130 [Arthrobacter sp. NPDC093128]